MNKNPIRKMCELCKLFAKSYNIFIRKASQFCPIVRKLWIKVEKWGDMILLLILLL